MRGILTAAMLAAAMVIAGCASAPPKRADDACTLFKQRPKWHQHTLRAARKWKAPAPLLLAIMKQESGFDANAKPRRKKFLGIPTRRPSSAFGYPQAIDGTWRLYRRATNSWFAQRDNFKDAMDFIGWYVTQTRKRLKIPASDAYRNYLAYHEGWSGYARGTYKRKRWLRSVAKRVATQTRRYRAQMVLCGYKVS